MKELAKDGRLNVVAINYKDKNDNALRFLGELGNPFAAIGVDPKGQAAIDWGVYGIPESYLVAPDGTILYKRVGPFDEVSLEGRAFPRHGKGAGQAGVLSQIPLCQVLTASTGQISISTLSVRLSRMR